MSISSNIKQLQASIPEGVTLVAVSKFHPVEALQEAYAAGQRVFWRKQSTGTAFKTGSDAKRHSVALYRASAK